ncbi:oxidoreductase [Actinoplanes sp. SE50]|uniref:NAD(P)/FAD-dependent oxidoreductase n=1 Tax=unclassified Actinoplanes TaxID=2626549 RepID=UPI00023EBB88|nr:MULTISPECIES: FAD-binding oxidoreductase [unclassified Actinoplanes]AEV84489.1 sarcosine oxidase [Actinoplanes sp. SE50/110]ATO82881.1 oxidoreductase [Actinoplanes sp. SE50]SLM00289.1 oxidoreductase [Actinoplanes sp. SE50/110]
MTIVARTRRVLVVGAGVTGLLTAVACARAGYRVTVLDRGGAPDPGAASYDQHRAFRAFIAGDPQATGQLLTARRRWRELEALLGGTLFRRVGVVTSRPRDQVDALAAEATAAGAAVEVVDPGELPHMVLPAGSVGLKEHDAGVLLAARVLRAAARWLAGQDTVQLCPGQTVSTVDTQTGRVRLASGRVLGADLILVAAGAWTRDLVDSPVVLYRQTMVYLRPPDDLRHWWNGAPAAGGLGPDRRAWLVPSGAGTLLKLSTDAVCRVVSTVRPDDPAPRWTQRVLAARIVRDAGRYTVVGVKDCHYAAAAAGGGALLVRAGPTVWSRAACGGSGFSTAPLVADRIVQALSEAL